MDFDSMRAMIFVAVLCFLAPVRANKDKIPTLDCSSTRDYFLRKNIGLQHIVPDNPSYDPDMEICYDGANNPEKTGCCTHQMERRYIHAAKKTFKQALKSTNSYMTNIFHSHARQYQDYFLGLVSVAENRTLSMFTEVYKIEDWNKLESLITLYSDLNKYIKHKDVNIHEKVGKFFDQLFPAIFHKIMNDPSTTDYSSGYKECLTVARQKLDPSPFGDYPQKIALLLSRSFSTARTLLDALKLGTDVMNTTELLSPEPHCAKALTRMQYCSHCDGNILVKPCTNFCLNVMRGCLAKVQDMDMEWNRLLDSVSKLTSKMKGSYSIEEALKKLDSKISEAMLHAMDTGPRFYSQVISKCGHPKVATGTESSVLKSRPSASNGVGLPDSETMDLQKRLELFTTNVMSSKRFFHNLADLVCSKESYFDVSGNRHCWNGERIGQYTKRVTPVNLNEQLANNPEVNVQSRSAVISALSDRLQENNKQLERKVASEQAQSDQPIWPQVYDPYANSQDVNVPQELGSTPNYQGDDEDYTDESGSGSGQFKYDPKGKPGTDEDFYETTTKNKGAKSQGKIGESSSDDGSGAISVHRTVLALIPTLLVVLCNS